MFAASSIHKLVSIVAVAAVALWAAPALANKPKPVNPPKKWDQRRNDGRTVSQGWSFSGPNPFTPHTDNRPPKNHGPTSVTTDLDWYSGNVHGHVGVFGLQGKKEGKFEALVWNQGRYKRKFIWIQYDYYAQGGEVTQDVIPGGNKSKKTGQGRIPPKGKDPRVGTQGWKRRTYWWTCEPQPEMEKIVITLKGRNAGAEVYIDNLFLYTHCLLKGEKAFSFGCYFGNDFWPPESDYEYAGSWWEGTQWDRYGSCLPAWMPELAGHSGVMGLPGGFAADGVLTVRCDDWAEAEGVKHVACGFEYYAAEGGMFQWEQETPPETAIENYHEEILELEEGWQRCLVTFDVAPPPDWQEFRFLMFTDPDGGPVAISNVHVSASTLDLKGWLEGFDAYENGSGLHGQSDWQGWDNDPAFDACVTDAPTRSGFRSVDIVADADLVQPLDGYTRGQWEFMTWMYVPEDFQSGCDGNDNCGSYCVLLNTYNDGGPYHWSVQLHADSTTNSFIRDGVAPASLPLITGEWVEIKVFIDLDNDLYQVFYDGQELGVPESWTAGVNGGGGGALKIGALDLYANGSTSVYYDDINLVSCNPNPGLSVEVEQNGISGKITARVSPGSQSDFDVPASTDPSVVEITSLTWSDTVVDGMDCGQVIVQYETRQAGEASITLSSVAGVGENVPMSVSPHLFAVSIPGGVDFGQVYTSHIPPGDAVTCTLMIIDGATGEPDSSVNGLARAALDNTAFAFDGETQSQEIEFIDGLAELTIYADGSAGESAYLEISDTDAPESVGGEEELTTTRIKLATDWSEDFDAYPLGSGMHGQGGWKGWDNDPTFDASVTDVQARSAPHSVEIAGNSDLVHPFSGVDTGQWTFTAWQYVPADFASDNGSPFDPGTYFLLLNTYNDGGPYNWSAQLVFDSNDGMAKVSYGDGHNTIDVPYVTEQWVEINIVIDLDIDSCTLYYDGALIVEYSWTGGIYGEGGGALEIAAVDLFANGSSPVFYDDLSLVPVERTCPGDLDGDGDTDHADLGIILADWGCSGGDCVGDLDGDGNTGHADLGILLADWGCGT